MKVKLTRIKSTHNNLRTKEVIGEIFELPAFEKPFIMFGKALTIENGTRIIETTPVKTLQKEFDSKTRTFIYKFSTGNSVYELEILEGDSLNNYGYDRQGC